MNLHICACKKQATKTINNKPTFGYKGGTFTNREILDARRQNSPLTMDCALPGTCLNNCTFCGFLSVNKQGKLEPHEIFRVFDEFAVLGGKSIKILGEGEPMLCKDILCLLKQISDLGMTPVLFTCGDVLGSEELAKNVHGCRCDQIIQDLYNLGVTVVLKYEKKEEDEIVQREGYSVLREKTLQRLMACGFNKHYPSRLGFAIVLLKQNYHEVPSIYEFALNNNIYPLICPLMPIGKMENEMDRICYSPEPLDIQSLECQLIAISERKGIRLSEPSDFPGGLPCDISRAGMYLDDIGHIKICESDSIVGNVRQHSLEELWKRCSQIKDMKYKDLRWRGLCLPKRVKGVLNDTQRL